MGNTIFFNIAIPASLLILKDKYHSKRQKLFSIKKNFMVSVKHPAYAKYIQPLRLA